LHTLSGASDVPALMTESIRDYVQAKKARVRPAVPMCSPKFQQLNRVS